MIGSEIARLYVSSIVTPGTERPLDVHTVYMLKLRNSNQRARSRRGSVRAVRKCGKTGSIPGGSAGLSTPTASSGGSKTWVVILAVVLVGAVICSVILAALLIPTFSTSREQAKNLVSEGNLQQIGLALMKYRMQHGEYPPAYVAGTDGKPLYSWRVLMLPYMDQEALYQKFDKTKAWDSPENKPISDLALDLFQNPNEESKGTSLTDYVAAVGDETLFVPPPQKVVDDMNVSPSTIAVGEIAHSKIHWAEPRDLDVSTMSMKLKDPAGTGFSNSSGRKTVNVALADARVLSLHADIDPRTLRELLTRNGKKSVDPAAFLD